MQQKQGKVVLERAFRCSRSADWLLLQGHRPDRCCPKCREWGEFMRKEVEDYHHWFRMVMEDQRREYGDLMRRYDAAEAEIHQLRRQVLG